MLSPVNSSELFESVISVLSAVKFIFFFSLFATKTHCYQLSLVSYQRKLWDYPFSLSAVVRNWDTWQVCVFWVWVLFFFFSPLLLSKSTLPFVKSLIIPHLKDRLHIKEWNLGSTKQLMTVGAWLSSSGTALAEQTRKTHLSMITQVSLLQCGRLWFKFMDRT